VLVNFQNEMSTPAPTRRLLFKQTGRKKLGWKQRTWLDRKKTKQYLYFTPVQLYARCRINRSRSSGRDLRKRWSTFDASLNALQSGNQRRRLGPWRPRSALTYLRRWQQWLAWRIEKRNFPLLARCALAQRKLVQECGNLSVQGRVPARFQRHHVARGTLGGLKELLLGTMSTKRVLTLDKPHRLEKHLAAYGALEPVGHGGSRFAPREGKRDGRPRGMVIGHYLRRR
jgi:hypothetical protein